MSAKIAIDDIKEAVIKIKKEAEEKKKGFVQSVDLQIKLKNYDPAKDPRFNASFKLPNKIKPRMRICVMGDIKHVEQAKELNLEALNVDQIKGLNKNKKKVKKMAKNYHIFLASASLIKKIPKLMGPGLSRAGKFPTVIPNTASVSQKIDDVQKTIKFQLKKEICLGSSVGDVSMTEDEITQNVAMAINFLASLLKKKWQNIGSVFLKGTMTKPNKLYP